MPEVKIDLKVNDVVQISPEVEMFGGCFMLVTEVRDWGAQGFVAIPKSRSEMPGHAFFRAKWSSMERIGSAVWAPERNSEEEG